MTWYVKVLKQYFDFSGRARRKEYWMFFLVHLLVSLVLGLLFGFLEGVSGIVGLSYLGQLYSLAIFIPSIAVGVRRMHDSDYRGWWLLFPFFNLYLLVIEGTKGANRFGPDPKENERTHESGAAIV